MAQQGHGDSGHATSIGTQGDQPVDGIAGSHPGTQEPSGAHVDAGKHRHQPGPREDGNRQHGGPAGQTQGGSGDAMQGGAGARGQRADDNGKGDAPRGTLQRGGVSSR